MHGSGLAAEGAIPSPTILVSAGETYGKRAALESRKSPRDRAAVCIDVWPHGGSIHASGDCLLRLSQSLARLSKT